MFDFASYHRASDIAEAISLLARYPQAKLLAGGTDVLIQLHHHNARYRHIVDIHDLPELQGITLTKEEGLRIGSATTFSEIIEHPVAQRHLPALCAAATSIAGPQIRNVATYGGNICNGATSADSATPTLIYDATLEITSPKGCVLPASTVFTPAPEKSLLSKMKSLLPFISHRSPGRIPAARILNMPCAMRWISRPLVVQHDASWITAVSKNFAWRSALRLPPRPLSACGECGAKCAIDPPDAGRDRRIRSAGCRPALFLAGK